MSVQAKSGGRGEFATSSPSAGCRIPTAAPVICVTSGFPVCGIPSPSGNVLLDVQVDASKPFEHSADQPRLTMMQWRHGVEEVRRHARAKVQTGLGLCRVGARMTEADDHAGVATLPNRLGTAWTLGRQRHDRRRAASQPAFELLWRCIAQLGWIVHTAVRGIDERSFDVDAERFRTTGYGSRSVRRQPLQDDLEGRADDRRTE